jgi:hypothetical protein
MRIVNVTTKLNSFWVAAMGLVAACLIVACSSSGESPLTSASLPESGETRPALSSSVPEQPAPEQPAPEQPAPEQPAPEQPAPEDSQVEPASDDGLTSDERALLIGIGLVVLAIAIGATALATRRSRDRAGEHEANQRRLDDITRRCRSIHDSAVLSLLQTNNPTLLQSNWAAARNQLIGLENQVGSLTSALSDEDQRRTVHELGLAVSGVRGALESNVNLRLEPQEPGQAELIEASNRTALYRSEQLESALQQVLYLRL